MRSRSNGPSGAALTGRRWLGAAFLVLSATAFWLGAASAAEAAHPFYTRLLREGTQAFDRGDLDRAAPSLRLAAFGLLDEPNLLVDALSRLALTQEELGDVAARDRTLGRILEIEIRFAAYSGAGLPETLRGRVEEMMLREVPSTLLAESSYFARILERIAAEKAAAPSDPPTRAERLTRKKAEKLARREQRRSQREAERLAKREASVKSPAGAEEATEGEGEIAALAATEEAEAIPAQAQERLRHSRRLLREARVAEDLLETLDLARDLADEYPDWGQPQFLAGEIAYRASRWDEAAQYFRRGGAPGDDRPHLLFYMAVSFFETGDLEAAGTALRESLPKIQRTPFVESYVNKILGENRAGG